MEPLSVPELPSVIWSAVGSLEVAVHLQKLRDAVIPRAPDLPSAGIEIGLKTLPPPV